MFRKSGKKIKIIAWIFFILGIVASLAFGTQRLLQYLDSNELNDLYWAIGIALGGIIVSFILSLMFYACGQLLDTAEDIADSNDEMVRLTRILIERVEHLPVVSLNSRFGNPPPAPGLDKKEPAPQPAVPRGSTAGNPWKCPECGNVNPTDTEKCLSCGQKGLWQCPKCGKVNPYSVDECTECGTLDTWICSACGEVNPRKNLTCGKCEKER